MDSTRIREINQANRDRAESAGRHEATLKAHNQLGDTVLFATSSLIKYLEGHTSSVKVINQLERIGTPDALQVIPHIKALHDTLKTHKNTDLSELTKVMQALLGEAKAIPKSHAEQQAIEIPDYTKQFESLSEAIRAVESVVKAQELVAEAPIVNVSPQVNVDAPDLSPLQSGMTKVVEAVKGIVIPEHQTDNKEVEKLLTKANRLLKELVEKPVGGGGGGGGLATPYQNSAGMPAFVELNPDGSIPIGGQLVPTSYDTIAITSYNGNNDPLTVLYKTAGVTVATLTLTYDGSNLSSVVRT